MIYLGIIISLTLYIICENYFDLKYDKEISIFGKIFKIDIHLLIIILLGIFLTTTYFNGSDWRQYEKYYLFEQFYGYSYNFMDMFENLSFLEPGYLVLQYLFQQIFPENFWVFFITMKILVFSIFFWIIRKYAGKAKELLVWLLLIPGLGLYLFIDAPFRNLIALGIALFAFTCIHQKKLLGFIILIILASTFHKSIIFWIPLYFIDFTKISSKKILIGFIAFNILLLFKDLFFVFGQYIPIISEYLKQYLENGSEYLQGTFITIGSIVKIMSLLMILKYRDEILKMNFGEFLFNTSIVFIFVYRLANVIAIAYRFSIVLQIFYYITIVLVVFLFLKKKKKIVKIAVVVFVGFYSLGITVLEINKNPKYLPYTNYLQYIFKEKPNYEYRSNYNKDYLENIK